MAAVRRKLSVVLIIGLLISVFATACSNNGANNNSANNVEPKQEQQQTGNQENKEQVKKEEPEPEKTVDISMFMSSSGAPRPDGLDPNNTKYHDFIEEYANVNLEIDMPNYSDEATRLNLLLASGQLPDIVHVRNAVDQANQAGRYGGFIDLTPYYEKSEVIKKVITPEMLEHVKDPFTGAIYRLPMAWDGAQQGYGNFVRYDMIEKYNDGVFPESVDEWVELLRKVHKAEPESILLTNRVIGDYGITYAGNAVFQWFGVRPYSFRVEDGKVINEFRTAEYRAAVELLKQLYDEGIVDTEFATADSTRYGRNLVYNNTMLWSDSATQLMAMATIWSSQEQNKDKKIVYAPPLKVWPDAVKDEKYTKPKASVPIHGGSGLYISSKAKDPERAWRVLEALATEEMSDMVFWGDEGEEYKVVDGKRVPDSEAMNAEEHRFGIAFGIVHGFYNNRDLKLAQAEQALDKDYLSVMVDSLNTMEERALEAGIGITSLIDLPDEQAKKLPDTRMLISQATIEAMMGKITMEQFDERVQQYIEQFGFIDDFYTTYMNEHKDELRAKGAVEVDW